MPSPGVTRPKIRRWPHEPTVFLLAYLNLRTALFSKNRNAALESLAMHLTDEYGEPYGIERVETKIYQLWKKCGPPQSKSPNQVYDHGVNRRTLPSLELFKEATFDELKAKMDLLMKVHPEWNESTRRSQLWNEYTRKLRTNVGDRWEMKCLCPFDTEDGGYSLECGKCLTWQHEYCYYEEHGIQKPEYHLCKECEVAQNNELEEEFKGKSFPSNELSREKISPRKEKNDDAKDLDADPKLWLLEEELSQLKAELQISNENKGRRILQLEEENRKLKARITELRNSNKNKDTNELQLKKKLQKERALGTFTTFGSSERDRGVLLPDSLISDIMCKAELSMKRAVITLPVKIVDIPLLTIQQMKGKHPDLFGHLRVCFGTQSDGDLFEKLAKSPEYLSNLQHLMRFLICTAIRDWIFRSDIFSIPHPELPVFELYAECIYDRDGIAAVENLHEATWNISTADDYSSFNNIVGRETTNLVRRLCAILKPLFSLGVDNPEHEDLLLNEWDKRGRSLRDAIKECLKLKARLSIRRQFFEFYMPDSGARFDKAIMEADPAFTTVSDIANQRVFLCMRPAVFRYFRKRREGDEKPFNSLIDFCDCITREDGERGDGVLISKAVVLLQ